MLTYSGSRSSGGVQAGGARLCDVEVDPAGGPPRGGRTLEVDELHESRGRLRQVAFLAALRGVNSSSRWFSIAIAAKDPSGLMAMESGWPPRSMLCTRVRSLTRTTSTRPTGWGEVAAGGVDDDEDELADGGHRGGLVVGVAELGERKRAEANDVRRVANVEEADAFACGVGVDDGVAVGGGDGGDLGDGLGG